MLLYYFLNLDTIYCITKKIYTYSQCLLLLLLSINKKYPFLKREILKREGLGRLLEKKNGKER